MEEERIQRIRGLGVDRASMATRSQFRVPSLAISRCGPIVKLSEVPSCLVISPL
jgi:hypothetical protein